MKEIIKSFIKFQSEVSSVAKDAQNPFFKSDYLTLSGILDAVKPSLSTNGLALTQVMKVDNGINILITKVMHESGQEIVSEMILPNNPDPQKHGSAITYYKRYQLQALLGISTSDEDDDGNSASGHKKEQPKQEKTWNKPVQETFANEPKSQGKPVSDAQRKAIYAIAKSINVTPK